MSDQQLPRRTDHDTHQDTHRDKESTMSTQPMPAATAPQRDRGLHPVNSGHLVMGVAFAGLVVIWALIIANVVADDDVRWLLPIPWVVAGAVGLVVATTNSFRRAPAPMSTPTHDVDPTGGTR